MTNSKYVPKRRFKEFVGDGEWEQNQLKELAEFSKGRGYSKSELQTDGQPIILYGRLYTKYETVISTVDTFTHIKENSVLSKGGEVLVPSSGESAEDIARASVVAEEGIIIGGDLNIIKLCKKIEPIFLSLAISNGKQKEEISKRAQGKSVVHVNNDDLKQVNVLFPSISEQIQIGKFFQTIDALISNHQHKLDKLKNLKKAYLSEMFPAEGEHVPKRRFPGFEGEWEQKKLGQLMDVGSVKRVHQSDWRDRGVRFLRARDIVSESKNNRPDDFLYIDEELYKKYSAISGVVEKGDLLVTGVGTIGVPMLVESSEPLYFKDGNIIWFKNKNLLDGHFFYYSFTARAIQKFIGDVAGVGTVGTYTIDSGKNTPILLPVTKEEQVVIGNFFNKLDQSISLQQQKLDKLNDLKKAYLNELFV